MIVFPFVPRYTQKVTLM